MTNLEAYALRLHIRDRLAALREHEDRKREIAADTLTPDEQAAQWAYDAWHDLLPLPDENRWRDQD